mmetsp:Transcript_61612/g.169372  ORF Transcript_61612/g.169372 Transcript_61612/m.169372 type:complete len:208 (-) Transcript_61612:15-638(-)
MGERTLQGLDGVQRRVPLQAAQVQVCAAALSPERVPVGHDLPLDPQRGGGLETRHHDQADADRHPGPAGYAEPELSGPIGGVPAVRKRPEGVRKEGSVGGEEKHASQLMRERRVWERAGGGGCPCRGALGEAKARFCGHAPSSKGGRERTETVDLGAAAVGEGVTTAAHAHLPSFFIFLWYGKANPPPFLWFQVWWFGKANFDGLVK